jgi:hypothetical protein
MIAQLVLLLGIVTGLTQARLIDRAGFLQGCWERRAGNRQVEEQWMKPRGGTMLGMARTVRGDTLIEYEFVRIFEQGGRLIYAAQPSGQPPAEFTSASIEAGAIRLPIRHMIFRRK